MAPTDIAHRTAEGAFARQLDDLILPQWWTGTAARDAAEFTIDAGPYAGSGALHENPELAERMRSTFDRVGLVHLVNTGLTELADMRLAARIVLDAEMAYEGGANPRVPIEPNVYEVGAPLAAHLHYHHEMAYIGQSTKMVAFLAKQVLPWRGATWVSDSVAATEALLETDFGRKLADKGVCYHRLLTDRDAYADRIEEGVYNHWQRSLSTDDPAIAEERARERGLVTEWGNERLLRTKYYVSAFEYFPQMDRNLLYCSVADHGMWFDA
ncbi:MAG: syringomycin synthesis regulator SyrP, partial [Acidimicrobiales bacterium]|nr:syringomycin synthesis regulator SyrP [Acidimicrobiales bacterium]